MEFQIKLHVYLRRNNLTATDTEHISADVLAKELRQKATRRKTSCFFLSFPFLSFPFLACFLSFFFFDRPVWSGNRSFGLLRQSCLAGNMAASNARCTCCSMFASQYRTTSRQSRFTSVSTNILTSFSFARLKYRIVRCTSEDFVFQSLMWLWTQVLSIFLQEPDFPASASANSFEGSRFKNDRRDLQKTPNERMFGLQS